MKYQCKDCNSIFEITESEVKFYESKNLSLPKRCKSCRDRNKQNKNVQGKILNNKSLNFNKKILSTIIGVIVTIMGFYGFYEKPYNDTNINTENELSYNNEISFRNENLLEQHYVKHGIEMGFSSAEMYEDSARAVIENPMATYKLQKEDGDLLYYLESTNEFVVVSTDGYIRTYFYPNAGIDYFNKQ